MAQYSHDRQGHPRPGRGRLATLTKPQACRTPKATQAAGQDENAH